MVGAVGTDETADNLEQLLKQDGVNPRYVRKNHPTGTTVALVRGPCRMLVAHLGAAEVLAVEDLNADILTELQTVDLVYIEGFFLTKRLPVATLILDKYDRKKTKLAFNLSARYMCEEHPEVIKLFSKEADLLFGNRREFEALLPILKAPNFDDIFNKLAKKDKVIVITDGPEAVICWQEGQIHRYSVSSLEESQVIDTTGAGDAFVAGFLAGYLLKRTSLSCTELGCYAAQEMIKRTGCSLPPHTPRVQIY